MHEDWTLGWGEVAKAGLDIVEVPGNHAVLLSKPYIETVGAVIREGLAKARGKSARTTA
jgi:thioesterase domain-containing protein